MLILHWCSFHTSSLCGRESGCSSILILFYKPKQRSCGSFSPLVSLNYFLAIFVFSSSTDRSTDFVCVCFFLGNLWFDDLCEE